MTSADLTPFFRQLRYWSLHVPLNALPSFLIARSMKLHLVPGAMGVMAVALFAFILALSAIMAASPGLHEPHRPFARALRIVMKLRVWMCIPASVLVIALPQSVLFIPDLWFGALAAAFVTSSGSSGLGGLEPDRSSAILFVTAVEGMLLVAAIGMLTFFIGIELNARDRRKRFSAADSLPLPQR